MLSYGTEAWCLSKGDIKCLEAMELWIWRQTVRVIWSEHVTNQEVLHRVNEETIDKHIRELHANGIGYVLCHDSLLRDIKKVEYPIKDFVRKH